MKRTTQTETLAESVVNRQKQSCTLIQFGFDHLIWGWVNSCKPKMIFVDEPLPVVHQGTRLFLWPIAILEPTPTVIPWERKIQPLLYWFHIHHGASGRFAVATTVSWWWHSSCHRLQMDFLMGWTWLVGGLEHVLFFPSYWECHHPNWRTHIFQRGRYTTNQMV